MSTLRKIFVLGAVGLAGCATTSSGTNQTASDVATGAIAVANLALVAAPQLEAGGKISATSEQDIIRDANTVIAAANTVLACVTAAGQSGANTTCATTALSNAVQALTADHVPATTTP